MWWRVYLLRMKAVNETREWPQKDTEITNRFRTFCFSYAYLWLFSSSASQGLQCFPSLSEIWISLQCGFDLALRLIEAVHLGEGDAVVVSRRGIVGLEANGDLEMITFFVEMAV